MSTLNPLVSRYLRHRRSMRDMAPVSLSDAAYTLAGFSATFGDRTLNFLTKRAIERWLATIAHLAPATRRNYLSRVRMFLDWMVDQEIIDNNPALGFTIKQPRAVPRALPRARIVDLMAGLPDNRARAIVQLQVGLGLRCVEVSRLSTSDYDPEAMTLLVKGKGSHERFLPVTEAVASALDRYLAETGRVAGPLIRSYVKPWAGVEARTISGLVRRWMRDAGVKGQAWDGVSAHALRHSAASDVLDRCHDVTIVQAMLGHQNAATTSRYLRRANLGKMREAMEGRSYSSGEAMPVAHAPPLAA